MRLFGVRGERDEDSRRPLCSALFIYFAFKEGALFGWSRFRWCSVFAVAPEGVDVVGTKGTWELPSLRSIGDVRNQLVLVFCDQLEASWLVLETT